MRQLEAGPSSRSAPAPWRRSSTRERPDLVGLQEVSRWTLTPPGGEEQVLVDFLPTLLDELERAGCAYDVHAVDPNFGGGMPLDDGWVGLLGCERDARAPRQPVEVVGEATATYASSFVVVTGIEGVTFPVERGWGRVDVLVEGRPLRFVNTHTEAYDGPVRDAQRDELLGPLAEVEDPVVVVGDFNAGPEAVGMPPDWTDAWTRGEGDGFTCGQAAELDNPTSALRRADRLRLGARRGGDRLPGSSGPTGGRPDHAAPALAVGPRGRRRRPAGLSRLSRADGGAATWSRCAASCRPAGAPWSRGSAGSPGASGPGERSPR